ncbi:2-amino-4-hydroxy-6-hydroxymethyldihydropteridine diphosphokinase [uncultured Erythrobacter sp.]|uniref:2-amino-4-hydroxy-6- hydroxymethyldihydropteridine diphosphokinase n=1 Tax=uncultured Erythrobacter sp. TaxID=263913 RepID=UPI003416851C
MIHTYLIALGSNMRSHRHGPPREVLARAAEMISLVGIEVVAVAKPIASRPIGPSSREYANGAAIVRGTMEPRGMLLLMQDIERKFGRERRGQRWRARVLDLDIVLWSGGTYHSPELTIPHPEFRHRDFVLGPAASIAGDWRDPETGLSVRQLAARLAKGAPR